MVRKRTYDFRVPRNPVPMSTLTAAPRFERAATDVDGGAISPRSPWLSQGAAFVLLALIVAGIGAGVYLSARRVMTDGAHANLESVARIKVDLIRRWIDDARREADLALNAPMFVAELERWVAEGAPAGRRRALLLEHLQATAAAGVLEDVEVRAADDGRVLLTTAPVAADDPAHRAAAMQAAADRRLVLQDFHADEYGQPGIEFGIHVPIGGSATVRSVATAHLEIDAAVKLLPFLNQWPGTSPSAETLLFRVDGDDILFVNHSRHENLPALTMNRRADEPTLLAAQVARGAAGALAGTDYRGVGSIGYALPVDGTPWYLIAKVDRSEALAGLHRTALLAAAALLALLAASAAWWSERSRRMVAAYRTLFERALLTQRLEFLARHANEGILLADPDGRILEVNSRCATMYGYRREEIVGRNVAFLWGEKTPRARFETVFEAEQRSKDGIPIAVEISSRMIEIDGASYFQALVRDVTARRQAEDELRRSEERASRYANELEDLYQNAPCGYHSIDADGIVRRINDTELRWLGYAREEVVGRMYLGDLLDEASRERFPENFARFRRDGRIDDYEIVFLRKDGTPLPAMVSATAIYDAQGEFVATRTTVVDLSRLQALRRERDRQARRIEALSRHLVAVQEEERRRLSCDLHDRAAPNLAALKLTLDTLGQMLPVPHAGETEDCMADARALIEDTVAGVREVCADLRPSLLDYAGLMRALVGYTQQYTRRTGIAVRLRLPAVETRLGAETESILFRIVQEALANVARHANARSVDIVLAADSARVRLLVKDDGIGFAAGAAQVAGPGIRTMRERAEFAGGRLICLSHPGKGTEIHVELAPPPDTRDSPWRRIVATDTGVVAP